MPHFFPFKSAGWTRSFSVNGKRLESEEIKFPIDSVFRREKLTCCEALYMACASSCCGLSRWTQNLLFVEFVKQLLFAGGEDGAIDASGGPTRIEKTAGCEAVNTVGAWISL